MLSACQSGVASPEASQFKQGQVRRALQKPWLLWIAKSRVSRKKNALWIKPIPVIHQGPVPTASQWMRETDKIRKELYREGRSPE